MSRMFRISLLLLLLGGVFTPSVFAQSKADFLGVEGAKGSVAKALTASIRAALKKQKGLSLLPANASNLGMTRLMLGCVGDTAACNKRIASTRGAKVLFHVKLTKAGGSFKAVFRQMSGSTGATVKTVNQTFTGAAVDAAGTALVNKMFGVKPAPRPVPVARRTPPPARRDDGGWPVVTVRRTPPPRVRPLQPRPRVVEPGPRRAAPVVARRVAPKRRTPVVVRRPAPVRRKPVVARRPAPRKTRPGSSSPNRLFAWIAAGVAVAATGGMVAAGLNAQAKGAQIDDLIQKSNEDYDVNYRRNVEPLENQGRNSAMLANVLLGVAVAAAATSVVLFVLPTKKPAMRKSTQVAASKQLTVKGQSISSVRRTKISF